MFLQGSSDAGLSRHRNVPFNALRPLHNTRQHRPRRYQGAGGRFQERVEDQGPQYVELPALQLRDHRTRRLGGSRGPYSLYRSRDRFQRRPQDGTLLQEYDHTGRLRSRRCRGRHIQGPYGRRCAFHSGDTALQHLDVLHTAVAALHCVRDGGVLSAARAYGAFRIGPGSFRNEEHTVLYSARGLLCPGLALFHQDHAVA